MSGTWTAAKGRNFWLVTSPDGRTVHVADSAGPGHKHRTEAEAIALAEVIFRKRKEARR